jgi:sulfate transport system ATP-binding protein
VLKAAALSAGTIPPFPSGGLQSNGHIYVRPHDIEVVPHETGAPGIPAVLRYIHAAGPAARLTLEQVESRETVEAEISRIELERLGLKLNNLVLLRLRQTRSFADDYAI